MRTFVTAFASSFVAILLGVTGANHMLRLSSFREVIRSHGTFPPMLAGAIALVVGVLELTMAAGAGAVGFVEGVGVWRGIAFALATAAGCVFAIYLQRLLRSPVGAASCGCSPLESSLSPLSLLPALSLAAVSAVGCFLAVSVSSPRGAVLGFNEALARLLGAGWGLTTAGLMMLMPASLGTVIRERQQR
jgi:hypothetical protein